MIKEIEEGRASGILIVDQMHPADFEGCLIALHLAHDIAALERGYDGFRHRLDAEA